MTKFDDLLKGLTPAEKRAVVKGLGAKPVIKKYDHHFTSKHLKFGYYSDPHVGHSKFIPKLWDRMVTVFKQEGIETVYCPGDNLEGMSNREGHIYELAHVGASAQLNYASQLFQSASGLHFFIIDGNHDQWFKMKSNIGLVAGQELQKRNSNVTFLGEWEADVVLGKGVVMKLYHANDGSAYAISYKIQKLIESLEGGEKPNIILSGHYHKQIQVFTRNVFGFECGTLMGQSQFMRGKKLAAHKGFGIIEVWMSKKGGVERLRHEFFPSYD